LEESKYIEENSEERHEQEGFLKESRFELKCYETNGIKGHCEGN